MENKGLELAQQMADYVNTYSVKDKVGDFVDGFCRQHRTLQQSSFRLILALIEHIASDGYRTDGRNEDSKKVAKMLLNGFQKEYHETLRREGVSEENIKSSIGENFIPSKFLSFV